MAMSNLSRTILTGVALGVVIGSAVGLVGAILEVPMVVRGAITGFLVVVGFALLQRSSSGKTEKGAP